MTSRTWSSILCIGMMRAACAIAASSPASRHSCRNTLFSTWRIAGFSPKLTFERPSTVDEPGSSVFTRRIASMVSMPSLAQLLLAGAEREREHVEDQVGRVDAVLLGGERVDALADPQLPVGVARLALLVDREADDAGAVLLGHA